MLLQQRTPTLKMLALSFLLLVGVALVAEGFDLHIPRGYIYFAMAFSVFVEILNISIGLHKNATCLLIIFNLAEAKRKKIYDKTCCIK